MFRTLVIVPVFNEEQTVKNVLEQIRHHSSADILVVNDGSTDDSLIQVQRGNATYIINHEKNMGPGGALISGFKFAIESNYDVLITIDADGQHLPEYIPKFIEAISDVDMVVGSRYLPDSERKSRPPKDRELANQAVTKLTRKYINYNITDYASGFRAYRVPSLRKLRITETGYAWPFQLWIQAYEAGFRVKEIPIPLLYLDYKRGSHGEFGSMKEALAKAEKVMNEETKKSRRTDAVSAKVAKWTRDNVGEVIPDLITPLSWSILAPIVKDAFLHLNHQLGTSSSQTRYLDCFYGRVYINTTAYQSVQQSINPFKERGDADMLSRLFWGIVYIPWSICFLPLQIRRSLTTVPKEVSKLRNLNLKTLSSDEILNRISSLQLLLKNCMRTHLAGTMVGETFADLLKSLIRKWSSQHSTIPYPVLFTGLSGMKSAKSGIELWKISKKASLNEKTREIIMKNEPSETLSILETLEDGKEFASEIKDFITEYGSFSLQEFELSYPRWENDPTFLLKTLKNYMLPGNSNDPLKFESIQRTKRLEITQRIRKELTSLKSAFPYKRAIFDVVLFEAQHYVVWRENMKQNFVLAYCQLYNFYRELANRFVDRNLLEEEKDFYFLTAEEIGQIIDGQLKSERIDQLVYTRKREREANLKLAVPNVIETSEGLNREIKEEISKKDPASSMVLKGIGCSIGRTTGKAQVVLDPANCGEFEKGGILVAPFTSPSWTPLFLTARAIVTEVGGVSSHGAIVAREYGIPCVTSVKNATKIIKNGEILTVDGEQGIVYIDSVEEAEKS
jgi:glycosyltransferase involved in cell wall biosynthesis/phosphohistidine swiveling domain-containing protein